LKPPEEVPPAEGNNGSNPSSPEPSPSFLLEDDDNAGRVRHGGDLEVDLVAGKSPPPPTWGRRRPGEYSQRAAATFLVVRVGASWRRQEWLGLAATQWESGRRHSGSRGGGGGVSPSHGRAATRGEGMGIGREGGTYHNFLQVATFYG
jgi:hypothetical protein